jgi:hypothetical protein
MGARSYRVWGHTRVIDRAVYGTIVVTSVLAVYDGWANPRLLDAAAILLGHESHFQRHRRNRDHIQ